MHLLYIVKYIAFNQLSEVHLFFLDKICKIHGMEEKITTLSYFALKWFDCYFGQRMISI